MNIKSIIYGTEFKYEIIMSAKSQTPALTRGLEIITILNQEPDLTVDQLVRKTGYPRASLFRILGTLMDYGAVYKNENSSTYRASMMLVPVSGLTQGFQDRILNALNNLAVRTGHAAEWYVPADPGMVLVLRRDPPGQEVTVRARIGFVRSWIGELDAVAAAAYAFLDREPGKNKFWTYVEDGKQGNLTAVDVKKRIQRAEKDRCVADTVFNSNGVRRSAAVVFNGSTAVGVIAVAECMGIRTTNDTEQRLAVLREEAEAI